MDRIQVDILGLSTSPSSGGAYALILSEIGGGRRLPIVIGAFEAQAIALELEKIRPPRPLTHDLMRNMMEAFDVQVSEVVISELRDGTFYAKIHYEQGGTSSELDSRPSDAIALAVRCEVPIYVSAEVLREAGIVAEGDEPGATESEDRPSEPTGKTRPRKPAQSKIETLNEQLDEAIKAEDYERAAKIRDEIAKLKPGGN